MADLPLQAQSSKPPLSSVEALLEAVLTSTNEVVYALDREWRFVLFNAAAERYFGTSREAVLGCAIWDLFPILKHRQPDLPAIIVSGYAETIGLAADLPRLSKPFRQAELASALNALLAQP